MSEIDARNPKQEESPLPEAVDMEYAGSVWEMLISLGEEIGRAWQSPKNGVELLSEMRRYVAQRHNLLKSCDRPPTTSTYACAGTVRDRPERRTKSA